MKWRVRFGGVVLALVASPSLAEEQRWHSCLEEALTEARRESKPVLVYVFDGI